MPISVEAHLSLMNMAYAYRQALVKCKDVTAEEAIRYRNDGNYQAAAAIAELANYMTIQIGELRPVHDHHLELALRYYTPSRLKHNERMKLAQRKHRTGTYEPKPKEPLTDERVDATISDPNPTLSPDMQKEYEKWKNQ